MDNTNKSDISGHKKTISKLDFLLRESKKLHRKIQSGSVSKAMPIVRRLHASKVFFDKSASEIYQERHLVKRKHILRLIAKEAGFNSWEEYKPTLDDAEDLDLAKLNAERDHTVLKVWCSSEAEAQEYVAIHGGTIVRHGNQAVVLLEDQKEEQQ